MGLPYTLEGVERFVFDHLGWLGWHTLQMAFAKAKYTSSHVDTDSLWDIIPLDC